MNWQYDNKPSTKHNRKCFDLKVLFKSKICVQDSRDTSTRSFSGFVSSALSKARSALLKTHKEIHDCHKLFRISKLLPVSCVVYFNLCPMRKVVITCTCIDMYFQGSPNMHVKITFRGGTLCKFNDKFLHGIAVKNNFRISAVFEVIYKAQTRKALHLRGSKLSI